VKTSSSPRFGRAELVGALVALIVATVCARLGFWQLDRLAQRQHRNAAVAERLAAPPLSAGAVGGDSTGLLFRRIELSGEYDSERAIVVAGRSYMGSPGTHLLAPLRLSNGQAVLVNRGWLPAPDAATVDLTPYEAQGAVRLEGIVLPFPAAGVPDEAAPFRRVWYRLEGEALRAQFPYPVAPFYVQALPEPGAPDYPVRLAIPELDDGSHLGYAFQWFSFAVIAVVGWGFLIFRRRAHRTDRGEGPGRPSVAATRAVSGPSSSRG
jgi:surfeit locus 1 family protein